eukprot:Selendium_serpulae@DN3784_c0_g1_i3.p1
MSNTIADKLEPYRDLTVEEYIREVLKQQIDALRVTKESHERELAKQIESANIRDEMGGRTVNRPHVEDHVIQPRVSDKFCRQAVATAYEDQSKVLVRLGDPVSDCLDLPPESVCKRKRKTTVEFGID